MNNYFAGDYTGGNFKLFSGSHIAVLLIIAAANIMVFICRHRIKGEKISRYLRLSLAVLLILQELSGEIWHIYAGDWSLGYTLPLHLCGISVILSAVMLINKNYRVYEVVYFWGIGGATQALLTPDLGIYGFPHFIFFQFFAGHGLVVTACLFATFVFEYRPSLRSIYKAMAALNIYAVLIGIFNVLADGNYLYICQKPGDSSLMDYLGPWPYYIISLEAVALIIFFILYIPFIIKDNIIEKRGIGNKSIGI